MSLFSPREAGNPNTQRYIWLDTNNYSADMVRDFSTGTPVSQNSSTWQLVFEKQTIEWRGITFTITLTNKTQSEQAAPYVKIDSGMYHPNWSSAGSFSYWRHVTSYSNHDSFGMRIEPVSYPQNKNPATDTFGNKNSIYGINWFAPCLTIDNYVANGYTGTGLQMMSVSTNYPYPFKIYGEFDPVSLKAFFRLDNNVDIPEVGILDKFKPGETRSWKIWLRFENYNNSCLFDTPLTRHGNTTYRKIAALRSYEPYFVWYWNNNPEPNHGPRVSGRIYGVSLAGGNAPKSYFTAKDNPRRYYLFSTQDKQSLNGLLPLPGQSYIHPQKVSGWKQLLDNILDLTLLKNNGYRAAMLFNISGWGNNEQGGNPSYFANLPINLRNTLSELKKWEIDNSFRIIFAADNVLKKVNLSTYSNPAVNFDINNPTHRNAVIANFDQGGLKSVSGLSFLDMPNVKTASYIDTYLQTWRNLYSSVSFVGENRTENSFYNYVVPSYIDRYEFLTLDRNKGGRDWFLDMLMQGADPWVFMPLDAWYADYGNSDQTRNAYDSYAQFIESKQQVIPVTIGRIVQNTCLCPRKLNWQEDFVLYSSLAHQGNDSICRVGDPVLNRKVCLPDDMHRSYTSNPPQVKNMLGLYQFDFYYDWSIPGSVKQSWVPCSNIFNEVQSMSGNSMLWLYQDDKLQKAKQTVANNLQGFFRPAGPYIDENYDSDVFHNFEMGVQLTNGERRFVQIGSGLEMYNLSDTRLVISTPGSGLEPRTLRNWWIWVQDQINPGWATGKSTEQQCFFLQTEWASRWLYWIQELNNTIRQIRPKIKKIGIYGAVPEWDIWRLDGLYFGTQNPDITNTNAALELQIWDSWLKAFDYLAPSLYLFQPTANYDTPAQYIDAARRQGDPVQEKLFYLLCLRYYAEIGRIANKDVYIFVWPRYLRNESLEVNSNIGDFLTRSVYKAGCQGFIWWAVVGTRQATLNELGLFVRQFYEAARFVESRLLSHKVTTEAPAPLPLSAFDPDDVLLSIDPSTNQIPGLPDKLPSGATSSSRLAKFGRYNIVSLGGKTKIDNIDGFGIPRYNYIKSGAVLDKFPTDYSEYDVVAIANSVDGIITLSQGLSKYDNLQISIRNPSLTNVGIPHPVVEDTFEWVNSGMPSHLSQVHHANIVSTGISQERIGPGYQSVVAPAFQASFIVPKNHEFYDKINSTIDYNLFADTSNKNLTLPFTNCTLYNKETNVVYIGGIGGVLEINVGSKNISKLNIDADYDLNIKDLKYIDNELYVLDEIFLYKYDTQTQESTKLISLGLPKKLHSFVQLNGGTLCVGSIDGIYSKRRDASSFVKVLATSAPVTQIIAPDAAFAIDDKSNIYSTTDGFTWILLSTAKNKIINKIIKHRNMILVGTNAGIYQDSGTFYSGRVQLKLLDPENDIEKSANITINDIFVVDRTAYLAKSDGSYIVYNDDFGTLQTKFDTLHKIVRTNQDVLLFSGNSYQAISENFIRKLATGVKLS